MVEVAGDCIGDEREYAAVLLTAGFDDREQRFHEPAAGGALGAEREFPPDHRVTQRPLRRVVRRFDSGHIQERPQPLAMVMQLPAHAGQSRVTAEVAAQQQAVDLAADRLHQTLESAAGDRPVPATRPVMKQGLCRSHQVVPQAFHLVILVVDQGLKIAFEMRPAPLQAAAPPIHLGPVATHDSGEGLAQEFADGCCRATATEGEHREGSGHERPQPTFDRAFFRGRFVTIELRLGRQRGDEFRICRLERLRGDGLVLHRQRRAARNVQDRGHEQRRATFALPEAGHQQRHERDQFRPRLADRYAGRQRSTGRLAATGTTQAMALIFGDERLDCGEFVHLMPERITVAAREFCPAPAAGGRLEWHHLVAFLGRNQRPLVAGMPWLAATFLLRFRRGLHRLGMRMLRARGQRGILRSLVEPGLQVRDLRQQYTDDRLGLRRLPSNQIVREFQRHALGVADFALLEQTNFPKTPAPARERLPLKSSHY